MQSSRTVLVAAIFLMAMVTPGLVEARIAHGQSDVFPLDIVTAIVDDGQPPEVSIISTIYPNPFNPRTTIEFAIAEGGKVDLAIFDVQGRLVRRLDQDAREAGRYRATWNGRDDHGRMMPAGAYFCRLTTAAGALTQKLTLAK